MKRKQTNSRDPPDVASKRRMDLYPHVHSHGDDRNAQRFLQIETRGRGTMYIEMDSASLFDSWSSASPTATKFKNETRASSLHADKNGGEAKEKNVPPLLENRSATASDVAPKSANVSNSSRSPKKSNPTKSSNRKPSSQLLTHIYEPKHFADLLTDHSLNREALRWLRSWDAAVFHSKHENVPREKILLLAGPPGLGKTVLAHCIARHCGYEVMELNASDDRSQNVMMQQVMARVQSGSVIHSERPKLVLLDEIDGASGGAHSSAVKSLVHLAKNKKEPLLRPIICTCNDLYASVLRDLRSYAKIITFRRGSINKERVVSRLTTICQKEHMAIPNQVLQRIADIYEGDIRSCLNALQMVHFSIMNLADNSKNGSNEKDQTTSSSKHDSSNRDMSRKTSQLLARINNLKDIDRGYFDVMRSIFEEDIKSLSMFRNRLGSGDWIEEGWLEGCFANYAAVPLSDPYMKRMRVASNFLSFADWIQSRAHQLADHHLESYTFITLYALHLVCHASSGPGNSIHFQLPTPHHESRRKKRELLALAREVREGLTGGNFTFYDNTDIFQLIQPLAQVFKTVHLRRDISDTYLLDDSEMKTLQHLTHIHASLGLHYESEYNGQLHLQPNIFQLNLLDPLGIPENGTVFGLAIARNINQTCLKSDSEAISKETGLAPTTDTKSREDTPKKELKGVTEKSSPITPRGAFGTSSQDTDSPSRDVAIKFQFEDSASTAVRHFARFDEWL